MRKIPFLECVKLKFCDQVLENNFEMQVSNQKIYKLSYLGRGNKSTKWTFLSINLIFN